MQYFDTPDPKRLLKVAVILCLAFLTFLIIILALTAGSDEPQVTPHRGRATPATIDATDVTEQAIPLVDGRTVLCLFFSSPTKQITCDWATARPR